MHEHDLDLIAAYADGLAGSDSPQARSLIDTCVTCRNEYNNQQAIRSWLSAAPEVSLVAEERQRLRTSVLSKLGADAPVVSLSKLRMRRWVVVGSVAATLLVAVGLGGVLPSLRSPQTAADLSLETTAAASAEAETEGLSTAEALRSYSDGIPTVVALGEVDFGTLLSEIEDLTTRTSIAGPEGDDAAQSLLVPPAADLSCQAEVGGAPEKALTATVDGTPVEVYLVLEQGVLSAVAFVVDDCTPFPLEQ